MVITLWTVGHSGSSRLDPDWDVLVMSFGSGTYYVCGFWKPEL